LFAQVVAFPGTCDVGSLIDMPLFMRSNVAVILRTSAVVRPPPLIQACRPTGPCNSGGKKKKIYPAPALACVVARVHFRYLAQQSHPCCVPWADSPCLYGSFLLEHWISPVESISFMQKMAHFYCATLKTLMVEAHVHSVASVPRT